MSDASQFQVTEGFRLSNVKVKVDIECSRDEYRWPDTGNSS
jgi:hypothetical protein